MTKEYQNSDVAEHKEIDDKLMQIYEKNNSLLLNCYNRWYYACKFVEKPSKGEKILSGMI